MLAILANAGQVDRKATSGAVFRNYIHAWGLVHEAYVMNEPVGKGYLLLRCLQAQMVMMSLHKGWAGALARSPIFWVLCVQEGGNSEGYQEQP